MQINKISSLKYLLIAILFLGAILRLFKLNEFPVNLTPDEASLGYNAYSILKTARDEYGTLLPLTFKSFGDHKPGLYVYLTVPFVAIFGLNEWAVRLPSALMGILAVWLLYKIIETVMSFPRRRESMDGVNLKLKSKVQQSTDISTMGPRLRGDDILIWLPCITAFTLAISPWHINFSRGAWEANVSLTFTLLGIYLLLNYLYGFSDTSHNSSFARRGKPLILSAVFFGLTFWTYQGSKLSTPLALLALVISHWSLLWANLKTNFKPFIVPCSMFIVLMFPIIYGMFTGTGGRLEVFSIFSYERPQDYIEQTILKPANLSQDSLAYALFHSESFNFLRAILRRYFHYFSGNFLAFEGDWSHPQLTAPYTGVIHWPELLPLVIGFLYIGSLVIRGGLSRPFLTFILLWLILAPLPAALSRDEVNAVRSLNLAIPVVFLISFGWTIVINWSSEMRATLSKITNYLPAHLSAKAEAGQLPITLLVLLIPFALLLFSLFYYLDSYYFIAPYKTAHLGQGYGYRQIVETVQPARQAGKTVVLSQSYDQPYIYFLFYEKYDPATYQRNAFLNESEYGDVGLIPQVDDRLKFQMINWSVDQFQKNSVFVANPITTIHPETSNDPERFNVLSTINYPNNHPAFRIVEVL